MLSCDQFDHYLTAQHIVHRGLRRRGPDTNQEITYSTFSDPLASYLFFERLSFIPKTTQSSKPKLLTKKIEEICGQFASFVSKKSRLRELLR